MNFLQSKYFAVQKSTFQCKQQPAATNVERIVQISNIFIEKGKSLSQKCFCRVL